MPSPCPASAAPRDRGPRPVVRVGVGPGVPDRLVAAVAAELACLREGFACAVVPAGAPAMDGLLHRGSAAATGDELELLRDPWVLVVPAAWPLADAGRAPGDEQLARLRYVSGPEGLAQPLVAVGLGAAILPRTSVDEADARTVALPLGDRREPVTYGLWWPRGRESAPAAGVLAEAAATACARIVAGRTPLALLAGA